jgi:hypothetical protein
MVSGRHRVSQLTDRFVLAHVGWGRMTLAHVGSGAHDARACDATAARGRAVNLIHEVMSVAVTIACAFHRGVAPGYTVIFGPAALAARLGQKSAVQGTE